MSGLGGGEKDCGWWLGVGVRFLLHWAESRLASHLPEI